MKKLELDVETLQVASFVTEEAPETAGTIAAYQISAAAGCTTKTRGCPITWGCPYTTP
jgi:hypothetical protein